MDRFFRGIGNRMRGQRAEEAADSGSADDADSDVPAMNQDMPPAPTDQADEDGAVESTDDDADDDTADEDSSTIEIAEDADGESEYVRDVGSISVEIDEGSIAASGTSNQDGTMPDYDGSLEDGDDRTELEDPGIDGVGVSDGSDSGEIPEPEPEPESQADGASDGDGALQEADKQREDGEPTVLASDELDNEPDDSTDSNQESEHNQQILDPLDAFQADDGDNVVYLPGSNDNDAGTEIADASRAYWQYINNYMVWVQGSDGLPPPGDPPTYPYSSTANPHPESSGPGTGWWANINGQSVYVAGPDQSGPAWFPFSEATAPITPLQTTSWEGEDGGYWQYINNYMVWVPGPDGMYPPGDPPEYPFSSTANPYLSGPGTGWWANINGQSVYVTGRDGSGPAWFPFPTDNPYSEGSLENPDGHPPADEQHPGGLAADESHPADVSEEDEDGDDVMPSSVEDSGDGTIEISGDGGTTDNDGTVNWGDGDWNFTIGDGDDGSVIIANPGDTEAISADGPEPEPEPDPYPEPELEPDESGQVGYGEDVDDVIVIDGATPVEADRPEAIRPDRESGTESPGFISAADAVRAGLIAPEDLRVQANTDFRGSFAGLVSNDDDDDDGLIPARQDERIEIPKVENQPAPGTGPPDPRPAVSTSIDGDELAWKLKEPANTANLETSPLPRSIDDVQVSRSAADARLLRDGGENLGSTLPPAVGSTTYSAFSASDTSEGAEEDPQSGGYEVSEIGDDGSILLNSSGSDDDHVDDVDGFGAETAGYWSLVDDEFVWVPGSDGSGPTGEPPQWPNQDDAENPLPGGGYFLMPDDPDEVPVWYPGPDGSVPNDDGSGYWANLDGEIVWIAGTDGAGPKGSPPGQAAGQSPSEETDDVKAEEEYSGGDEYIPDVPPQPEPPEEDEEPPPAYEPPPMYTIGDPVPAEEQSTGINPADLRVSGIPDLNQYIDPDRIQQRLAQADDDEMPADDGIERPVIKLERAPGESPPQVGSLDVMDTKVMAGDSEAGEPSKLIGRDAMAGDSEAGEPSKVLDVAIEREQPLEFVRSPEIPTLDAPIDFKAAPLDLQPQSVAQVETAIPAAIEPPSELVTAQQYLPVVEQPVPEISPVPDLADMSQPDPMPENHDDDDDPVG